MGDDFSALNSLQTLKRDAIAAAKLIQAEQARPLSKTIDIPSESTEPKRKKETPPKQTTAAPTADDAPVVLRKFTTELPPEVIKRLKRARGAQEQNERKPDTLHAIVAEAINFWCGHMNYK